MICTKRVQASDLVGILCKECLHTTMVHPGYPNPTLEACVICEMLDLIEKAKS